MGYAAMFHRYGLWVFESEAAADAFALRKGDFEEMGGPIETAAHCSSPGRKGIKFTRQDISYPQLLAEIFPG